MADKISTLVLDVDLECAKCNKKIRKALCKFDDIQSITFEEKKKKVIISGPFNPHCLINRLYCIVGCKIIKGHEIVPSKPPAAPKPEEKKPEAKKDDRKDKDKDKQPIDATKDRPQRPYPPKRGHSPSTSDY